MTFREYQVLASRTDQNPGLVNAGDEKAIVIPLLGIVGEAGSLLAEYKKVLRDGPAHTLFREHVSEELGDILWYLSNIASKFGFDLEDIATLNLNKIQDRWPDDKRVHTPLRLFDESYPASERLPRRFVVDLEEQITEDGRPKVVLRVDGDEVGARIQDNAYDDDGYRFHDIFHLAHLAILGWSPVLRKLLNRKRRSDRWVDEVEDGGRAIVIEEGIVAFVFDYARKHEFLSGLREVDYDLLKTIRSLVVGLEVRACSVWQWERAIHEGYRVWRQIRTEKRGRLQIDVLSRSIDLIA
jgi:NTP pyrophosphatase (non-canonical NTP hydrolase)